MEGATQLKEVRMRGEILTYDPATQTGTISGDDSLRYSFHASEQQGAGEFTAGARVDFVPSGDTATQIVLLAAIPATPSFGHAGHAPVPEAPGYEWKSALLYFNGRLRRQHFWISFLILLGAGVVTSWIPVLGLFIGLVLIWPNVAVQVKRLHDMGKSGWFAIIPWIATAIGFAMMVSAIGFAAFTNPEYFESLENEDPSIVLSMIGGMFGGFAIMALVNLAFLLWIGISDSQRGDNRFGPNPKGEN